MVLCDWEKKIKEWLNSMGIKEEYPYVECGEQGMVDNIEQIYYLATLSYETFSPIINKNHHYSPNELKNIRLIQKYQHSMGAYYSYFFSKRPDLTDEIIRNYPHVKIKSILIKANKKNRGLYFISSFRGYTSTTLFDNPTIEKGAGHGNSVGCGMYRKIRIFGRMGIVLPPTIKLKFGIDCTCEYPYILKGEVSSNCSIYHIYYLAYKYGKLFEVLEPRKMYSKQQKSIIRLLKRIGENDRQRGKEFVL